MLHLERVLSKNIKRGEIWQLDFDPQTYKEEPAKRRRPALVIQTNILNDVMHATVIVIPGTTNIYTNDGGDAFPLRVNLGNTCAKPTDLLIDQIRSVSRDRFIDDQPVAVLNRNQMKRVEDALKILQGF